MDSHICLHELCPHSRPLTYHHVADISHRSSHPYTANLYRAEITSFQTAGNQLYRYIDVWLCSPIILLLPTYSVLPLAHPPPRYEIRPPPPPPVHFHRTPKTKLCMESGYAGQFERGGRVSTAKHLGANGWAPIGGWSGARAGWGRVGPGVWGGESPLPHLGHSLNPRQYPTHARPPSTFYESTLCFHHADRSFFS